MKKHNYNVKNLLQILVVSFLLHSNVLVSCSLSHSVGFGSLLFLYLLLAAWCLPY